MIPENYSDLTKLGNASISFSGFRDNPEQYFGAYGPWIFHAPTANQFSPNQLHLYNNQTGKEFIIDLKDERIFKIYWGGGKIAISGFKGLNIWDLQDSGPKFDTFISYAQWGEGKGKYIMDPKSGMIAFNNFESGKITLRRPDGTFSDFLLPGGDSGAELHFYPNNLVVTSSDSIASFDLNNPKNATTRNFKNVCHFICLDDLVIVEEMRKAVLGIDPVTLKTKSTFIEDNDYHGIQAANQNTLYFNNERGFEAFDRQKGSKSKLSSQLVQEPVASGNYIATIDNSTIQIYDQTNNLIKKITLANKISNLIFQMQPTPYLAAQMADGRVQVLSINEVPTDSKTQAAVIPVFRSNGRVPYSEYITREQFNMCSPEQQREIVKEELSCVSYWEPKTEAEQAEKEALLSQYFRKETDLLKKTNLIIHSFNNPKWILLKENVDVLQFCYDNHLFAPLLNTIRTQPDFVHLLEQTLNSPENQKLLQQCMSIPFFVAYMFAKLPDDKVKIAEFLALCNASNVRPEFNIHEFKKLSWNKQIALVEMDLSLVEQLSPTNAEQEAEKKQYYKTYILSLDEKKLQTLILSSKDVSWIFAPEFDEAMIKVLSNDEVFYHLRDQIPDTDSLISFSKQCAKVNDRNLFLILTAQTDKMNSDQWVSLIFKFLELFPDKSQIILKDIQEYIMPRNASARDADLAEYQESYSIMSGFGKQMAEHPEFFTPFLNMFFTEYNDKRIHLKKLDFESLTKALNDKNLRVRDSLIDFTNLLSHFVFADQSTFQRFIEFTNIKDLRALNIFKNESLFHPKHKYPDLPSNYPSRLPLYEPFEQLFNERIGKYYRS